MPAEVLCAIVPAERVVLLLRVSKAISRSLLAMVRPPAVVKARQNRRGIERLRGRLGDIALRCRITSLQLFAVRLLPADVAGLAEVLSASGESLTHLNLSSNRIGGGVGQLAEVLARCPNLVTLNLRSNEIGDAGVRNLAVLGKSRSLSHLDLSYNSIGAEGCFSLESWLGSCHLSRLDISQNSLHSEGGGRLFAKCLSLSDLNLSQNRLQADFIGWVAGLAKLFTSLVVLGLGLALTKSEMTGPVALRQS